MNTKSESVEKPLTGGEFIIFGIITILLVIGIYCVVRSTYHWLTDDATDTPRAGQQWVETHEASSRGYYFNENGIHRCAELGEDDCQKLYPGRFGNAPTFDQCVTEKAHEPLGFWGAECPYGDCGGVAYANFDELSAAIATIFRAPPEQRAAVRALEEDSWMKTDVIRTSNGDWPMTPQKYMRPALAYVDTWTDAEDLRRQQVRIATTLLFDTAIPLFETVTRECAVYKEPE